MSIDIFEILLLSPSISGSIFMLSIFIVEHIIVPCLCGEPLCIIIFSIFGLRIFFQLYSPSAIRNTSAAILNPLSFFAFTGLCLTNLALGAFFLESKQIPVERCYRLFQFLFKRKVICLFT